MDDVWRHYDKSLPLPECSNVVDADVINAEWNEADTNGFCVTLDLDTGARKMFLHALHLGTDEERYFEADLDREESWKRVNEAIRGLNDKEKNHG